MKRIIIAGEKPDSVLSPLEEDILKILWSNKMMRVREIHTILKKKRTVAVSSIAVILDRLHSKNIVMRDIEKARGGMRYIYRTSGNKESFEKSALDNAVNKLMMQFGNTAVSYFSERFGRK
ncbi:MAG: BlaI/MecI/CopY family transcriptional regulator [Nanoarchaeota archaeon]